MRFKSTCLVLSIAAMFAMSCGSTKSENPTPLPDGSYSGEFRLIHVHNDNTRDTSKANITVYISPVSTGTYSVTGDTTTLHAGSKGNYEFYSNGTVQFADKTYSASAPTTKTHLNGLYSYAYDGNIFRFVAYGLSNTLILQYDLKKSGN